MLQETCPHCGSEINPGAVVCTGCQAERRVGPDGDARKGFGIFGAVAGGYIAYRLGLNFVGGGLIGGIAAWIGYTALTLKRISWVRRSIAR